MVILGRGAVRGRAERRLEVKLLRGAHAVMRVATRTTEKGTEDSFCVRGGFFHSYRFSRHGSLQALAHDVYVEKNKVGAKTKRAREPQHFKKQGEK